MKHPKPRLSHYIVVKVMFVPPQQFGWRIYQRGGKVLIRESATGYAAETDAWTAGSEELEQIFRRCAGRDSSRHPISSGLRRPARQDVIGGSAWLRDGKKEAIAKPRTNGSGGRPPSNSAG